MKLSERIDAFSALGTLLHSIEQREKEHLFDRARNSNAWFTVEQCHLAWKGIEKFLSKDDLIKWTASYSLEPQTPRIVGVVMAGNIPLVGFHDFMSVLLSGHRLTAKMSSQDSILMQFVINELLEIAPAFRERLTLAERMNGVDAIIATGSDNTSRYFEYYFRSIPHIIRKNRSSCAILTGDESEDDLRALGHDVFSYYGLGCRNVSKVFVPICYKFDQMFRVFEHFRGVMDHHKYANNYDYNKSIYLVNGVTFLDNHSILITENTAMVSPISVLYFEYWKDREDLTAKLAAVADKTQCIASAGSWFPGSVPFGKTQEPGLADYADGVDTLLFLSKL